MKARVGYLSVVVLGLAATLALAEKVGPGHYRFTYEKNRDLNERPEPEDFDVEDSAGRRGRARIETNLETRSEADRNRVNVKVQSKLRVLPGEDAEFDDAEFIVQVLMTHGADGDVLLMEGGQLRASLRREDQDIIRNRIHKDEFAKDAQIEIRLTPRTWRGGLRHAPGAIDSPRPRGVHVLIVPGIGGDGGSVRGVERLLETKVDKDGRKITAQIWDWTRDWKKPKRLQEQIRMSELTRPIGDRLAQRIREWDEARRHLPEGERPTLHIMGMSAGSIVLTMACEARSSDDRKILPNDVFDSVLYLSGALSIRHALQDVDRCVNGKGIYNYYSEEDDILTAAFPRVLGFIVLPISVSWPAAGRFGYGSRDVEHQHVHLQLPWLRDEHRGGRPDDLGNNGRHLRPGCLSRKYFSKFLLPLYTGTGLPLRSPSEPGGWASEIHESYQQDQERWKPEDSLRP